PATKPIRIDSEPGRPNRSGRSSLSKFKHQHSATGGGKSVYGKRATPSTPPETNGNSERSPLMKAMRHEPAAKSKKPKKKKNEPVNPGGVSRRIALKLGAAAGAVTMLTSRKSLASGTMFQSVPPEPTVCSPQPAHSPATTPFVQALPIP